MTDELQAIYDQTVEFVAKEVEPHGDAWETAGKVPRETLQKMGELGMLGLRVPEEHGGLGMGMLASAAFSEALGASTYAGFDVTVLVHTDMAGPHLVNSGTPEQLEQWMPGVLSGETILSIGVSRARCRLRRGRHPHRRSEGRRRLADQRHQDVHHQRRLRRHDDRRRQDRSGQQVRHHDVPRARPDTEGFSVANKLDKHGWRCSDTAELVLDDAWVPDSAVLGTVHRGFYETMKNFQNERMVLVGMGTGAAQAAIDLTSEYVGNRPAFGGRLSDLGAIRQRMAMNQAKVDAVRAGMYHAAWLGDQGIDNVREMSGVKAFGCEVVNDVMYDCLQFHGGIGYMRESTIERMTRDARILPIGGGATEVMLEEVAKRLL